MKYLIPFVGMGKYKLLQSTKRIIDLLELDKIDFEVEVWENEDVTNKFPWTLLKASNGITFYFAKDKLFKIVVEEATDVALENGIHVGMPMSEATKIDVGLNFDDWNEDWESPLGYWLEDDLDTNNVMSISIFIKEAIDDEEFNKYEW